MTNFVPGYGELGSVLTRASPMLHDTVALLSLGTATIRFSVIKSWLLATAKVPFTPFPPAREASKLHAKWMACAKCHVEHALVLTAVA